MGEFLPPVVTRLTGDLSDLASTIAEAKALIGSMDGKAIAINVRTTGISEAARQVAALKAAMAGLDDKTIRIGVDQTGTAGIRRGFFGLGLIGLLARGGGGIGNALHWMITGFSELMAVVIPATVAIAAWAAVWMQGATNVVNHMQGVYTATEATANIFHVTAGQAVGLGDALQRAQNKANPDVYLALGSAINLAREHAGGLTSAGLQLGKVFDNFSVKMVQDFSKGGNLGNSLNHVLGNMVQDATGLGQVFGNLGHILLGLGAQMPGLAEALLAGLSTLTRWIVDVIDAADKMRIFGVSIITVVMAFEEFNRWGGLIVALMARIGLAADATLAKGMFSGARAVGILRNALLFLPMLFGRIIAGIGFLVMQVSLLGGSMMAAAGEMVIFGQALQDIELSTGMVLFIAAVVAGLAFLIDKMATARSATQQWIDSLQGAIDKSSNLQVLDSLAVSFGKVSAAAAQTAATMHKAAQANGGGIASFRSLEAAGLKVGNSYNEQTSAMRSMDAQIVTVAAHAQFLANVYHTSLLGAMTLADQAGVHLNHTVSGQNWAFAQLKIASYVRGLQAMGASTTAVANDVTMMGIQSGLAATKVSQLNQASDQYMQNLVGGTSALASFEQAVSQLGTGANDVTNILGKANSISLSVKTFADSLTSFAGKGAQAWQNFNQVVGSTAPQIIDWLRTAGAEGAITAPQFNAAVRGMMSQLVAFGAKSVTARAELVGLAQSAGMNIKTWPQLISQLRNGHVSAAQLAQIIGQATSKMSDMSQIAANLGTVLQSDLVNALGKAAIAASGVTQDMTAYMRAVEGGTAATAAGKGARAQVISDLEKLGYTAKQAAGLVQMVANRIAGIHDKAVTLTVTTMYQSVGLPPNTTLRAGSGYAAGTASATSGYHWVGENGPELLHFRGGETVLPHEASIHRAAGGGGAAGAPLVIEPHIYLDGVELFGAVKRHTYDYNVANGNRTPGGRVAGTMVPR